MILQLKYQKLCVEPINAYFSISKMYYMVTLAFYNLKGGVGKTASAVNFAYLAAANGLKTLVWDLDPQGSSSFYFHVKNVKNESKKIFASEMDIKESIQDSTFENLWVIPADISARNADIIFNQSRRKLKSIVQGLKQFDLVILDCPPGISILHDNVFGAADWVLMPNIPTVLSIRSYETIIQYFKENDIDKAKIKCFFSMVDHRKNLHQETIQAFYNNKLFFKNYIPYLSDIEKMGVHIQPLFEFANSSYAALCYRELWKEISKYCIG
ncbi:MAG TPA: ParA family protein [Chitinophagaceae bacterium]|nr:ParA family protein [Chitinophagaceae bacterium]HNN31214.1 ParA family protein [Chitinophagaceae bacterium]